MMATDENFQDHVKLKMAVVWWVAPNCDNLCDCARAARRSAHEVCGGQRFGGGGVAGWRIKQTAGFTAVCELWIQN